MAPSGTKSVSARARRYIEHAGILDATRSHLEVVRESVNTTNHSRWPSFNRILSTWEMPSLARRAQNRNSQVDNRSWNFAVSPQVRDVLFGDRAGGVLDAVGSCTRGIQNKTHPSPNWGELVNGVQVNDENQVARLKLVLQLAGLWLGAGPPPSGLHLSAPLDESFRGLFGRSQGFWGDLYGSECVGGLREDCHTGDAALAKTHVVWGMSQQRCRGGVVDDRSQRIEVLGPILDVASQARSELLGGRPIPRWRWRRTGSCLSNGGRGVEIQRLRPKLDTTLGGELTRFRVPGGKEPPPVREYTLHMTNRNWCPFLARTLVSV